ncbi:MAG: alpha/beta fold hydrolase, partial [Planctomycetota bacterium]
MKKFAVVFICIVVLSGCGGQQMVETGFQAGETFSFSRGVELNFEKCGDRGPAVIFLHGFGASLATWKDIRD